MASVASGTKRKRDGDGRAADGVVVAAAGEDGAGRELAATSFNGDVSEHTGGAQSSSAASHAMSGGKPDGAGELRDALQPQGQQEGPPHTDAPGSCRRDRCECPCFCGARDTYSLNAGGRADADPGSRSTARVGSASADLSRVEQLVGGAAMVKGCALGVGFVARATEQSPGLSVSGALDLLDAATAARDKEGGGEGEGEGGRGADSGLMSLLFGAGEGPDEGCAEQDKAAAMASFCGGPLVALPRRFEVAAALHRLSGVKFRSAPAAAVADPQKTTSLGEVVQDLS